MPSASPWRGSNPNRDRQLKLGCQSLKLDGVARLLILRSTNTKVRVRRDEGGREADPGPVPADCRAVTGEVKTVPCFAWGSRGDTPPVEDASCKETAAQNLVLRSRFFAGRQYQSAVFDRPKTAGRARRRR